MQAFGKLISGVFLAASFPAAALASTCPELPDPPAEVCIASAQGLAYADEREDAQAAALAQQEAADRFEAHFGHRPRGVLVLSSTYDANAAKGFARGLGLDYALVWLPPSEKRKLTARALRRSGLDRARARRLGSRMAGAEQNTLRHEVGHMMYRATYWPDAMDPPRLQYGSPAPDWLDEAAAILMETAESQGARAGQFLAAAQASAGGVPPLAEFLQMEHPVLAGPVMRRLERGESTESGVQLMVSDDIDLDGVTTFYGQSLLLGMFLIEASGNPRILAEISAALAEGASTSDWFNNDARLHGLPGNLELLEEAWEQWLRDLPARASNN